MKAICSIVVSVREPFDRADDEQSVGAQSSQRRKAQDEGNQDRQMPARMRINARANPDQAACNHTNAILLVARCVSVRYFAAPTDEQPTR